MPTATFNGESVIIEGQGWLIYGGSSRTTALRLPKFDSTWADGPQLDEGSADTGICIVKVLSVVIHFFVSSKLVSLISTPWYRKPLKNTDSVN